MAKEFTEKPADFCFENCPCKELKLNTTIAWADCIPMYINNIIHCAHEDACEMWFIENQKLKEQLGSAVKLITALDEGVEVAEPYSGCKKLIANWRESN